jgi:hypothetical protein
MTCSTGGQTTACSWARAGKVKGRQLEKIRGPVATKQVRTGLWSYADRVARRQFEAGWLWGGPAGHGENHTWYKKRNDGVVRKHCNTVRRRTADIRPGRECFKAWQ